MPRSLGGTKPAAVGKYGEYVAADRIPDLGIEPGRKSEVSGPLRPVLGIGIIPCVRAQDCRENHLSDRVGYAITRDAIALVDRTGIHMGQACYVRERTDGSASTLTPY